MRTKKLPVASRIPRFLLILAVAAALFLLVLGLVEANPGPGLVRVTTASDEFRDSGIPDLNGDGTVVVFHSDSDLLNQGIPDDQGEIWLYDTTTITYTRITTASHSGRSSREPSVNEDGTVIAFASDSDFLNQGIASGEFEIWLYDTTAMTYTRVTTAWPSRPTNPWGINVSLVGTVVAFNSDSDYLHQGIPIDQQEIWLYDTATLTLTRVTTASDPDRDSTEPSLNKDGTVVAFESDSDFLSQGIPDDQTEIWLYDTTTMTYTRITTASHSGRNSRHPSLNSAGNVIAFQSTSDFLDQGISGAEYEIWLYDTISMTYTRITTASHSGRHSAWPSLSANETVVAFYSDSDFLGQGIPDDHREIWVYDIGRDMLVRVTRAAEINRWSLWPSLSADGERVAFFSDADHLGQGIPDEQGEVWLWMGLENRVLLPLVLRSY